jgi:serine/threonine protein kinase
MTKKVVGVFVRFRAPLKDEIAILKEIKHPNIIRLYDVFQERSFTTSWRKDDGRGIV